MKTAQNWGWWTGLGSLAGNGILWWIPEAKVSMPREIFASLGAFFLFLLVLSVVMVILQYAPQVSWTRGKRMTAHFSVIIVCIVVGAICGEIAWRLSEGRYAVAADIPSANPPKTEEKTAAPPSLPPKKLEREVQKHPNIQQHSKGANSPNIVGDGNVVNINPDSSGNARALQEIKDAVEAQSNRKKLLDEYPLGYVIFEVGYYPSAVIPISSHAILDKYDFDWSVVKFTKNTATEVEIRLPGLKEKDGTPRIVYAVTRGPKKVGNLGGYATPDVMVWGEILAIRDSGIVFLVGFSKP